ncbi:class I adenylate-forming enzyme family protein [Sabulicella glaciei]|uniref:AMP-binding protein n=1 Tax=Sabulicella glaciei TaxID=2984948 RepID=A0ABT3NPT1_9PROT|nr:AMP-binding protein [Roseococcus sp. MDT2-1-1]MCW8084166.1 AMP-binding protein [Roseococcus sp. MDT2-1-1]
MSDATARLLTDAFQITVGDLFEEQVRRQPGAPALEQDGRLLSYAALNDRVNRLCAALIAHGTVLGDRVAILSENRAEFIEVQLACAKLGVILACQNWRQSPEELAHCLALAEPRLTIVSERFSARLKPLDHPLPAIVLGDDYEALLHSQPARSPSTAVQPEDGLVILYTSGTTGMPKSAVISHRAMVARTAIAFMDGCLDPRKCFVAWAPLFHMGAADNVFGTLMHGGKVMVMDGFNAATLVELLPHEELGLLAVTGVVARVLEQLRRTPVRPRGITVMGSMPDLVPPGEIAEITALLGAPFRNTFGSTETGMAPASAGRIPIGVAPASFGKTQSSLCQIRLLDEHGHEVPDGTPGEVAFRGPSLFSGYWRNETANQEAFRGGWYHMGDVLRRNPDGTFDYVDRRKYLIKSGGENIYPAEIERVLLAHPQVADAAVVRRKDPRWGEVPVAFVLPRAPGLSADDLLAACRARIASYKLPREIRFVTESDLPRSTTGKIMRHKLEETLKDMGDAG